MAVAVIINPVAGGARPGSGEARARRAAAAVEAAGERGEIFVTDSRGHARELASLAVRRGARLVVAWGGDGTVNEVASALAFGDIPLGIVPAGSGNGLARDLRVSRNPQRAIREALAASPRRVDVGELGGRLFVNVAGVGFDAHVAACFARDNVRRGLWKYVMLTVRELARYTSRWYVINDAPNPRRALLVAVANSSQFGNGARIAPGARVDDGYLDLVVFEESSRLLTLCAIPRLFVGGVTRIRGLSISRTDRVVIECGQPTDYHVDGEPVSDGLRLEGRVHPAALKVCVR